MDAENVTTPHSEHTISSIKQSIQSLIFLRTFSKRIHVTSIIVHALLNGPHRTEFQQKKKLIPFNAFYVF